MRIISIHMSLRRWRAAPAVLNLGLQLANAFGFLLESGVVAYLFGLLIFLYTAGVLFVIVIVFRPADGAGVLPPAPHAAEAVIEL